MKKLTFPLLLATTLVAASCSNEEGVAEENFVTGDYIIELGGASSSEAITRAGFTGADTRLKLHFVSDKAYSNDDAAMSTNTKYMATMATAKINTNTAETEVSEVVYGPNNTGTVSYTRYWDNIHGKNSALSIYGIAVPNKIGLTNTCDANKAYFAETNENPWSTYLFSSKPSTETAISHEVTWQISATQTTATFADEDLTYTNNDSKPSSVETGQTGDNRLKFDGNKFQKANAESGKTMIFKHALSRLTLQVKKGTEYEESDPFAISAVKLQGFYDKGTLNVQTGEYTGSTTNAMDIVGSTTTAASGYNNAYTGLVGSTTEILESNTTTMITLVVDNNSYNVMASDIAKAIKATETGFTALEQGKHYILQVTINKTPICDVQAKLVDWTDVTGELTNISNARITISAETESATGKAETVVAYDLWKSLYTYNPTDPTNTAEIDAVANYEYKTGYNATTGGHIALDKDTHVTSWYWPNNLSFYHFRSLSPQGTTITTDAENGDKITLTSGQQLDTNDWIWGAPLKKKTADGYVYEPTSKGYGDFVFKAIGPTKDAINLTQFHMMSNLTINLTTETKVVDGNTVVADGGVDLTDAKIYLVRYAETGTMRVGDAFITPITTNVATVKSELGITTNAATGTTHTFRVVPQPVTRGNTAADKVGILIVTKDNNTYKFDDMSILKVSGTDNAITRWMPGVAYSYTFKITKTPIQPINAKLVDWATVTGTISNITLEN